MKLSKIFEEMEVKDIAINFYTGKLYKIKDEDEDFIKIHVLHIELIVDEMDFDDGDCLILVTYKRIYNLYVKTNQIENFEFKKLTLGEQEIVEEIISGYFLKQLRRYFGIICSNAFISPSKTK